MVDAQTKAEQMIDYYLQKKVKKHDLVFDNIQYTPSVTEPYIRVSHQPSNKVQASLGKDGLNRIDGVTSLYVSYPVGNKFRGTYKVNRTASYLVALFERKTLTYDNMTVRVKRSRRVINTTYDARYVSLVEVEWFSYVEKDTFR